MKSVLSEVNEQDRPYEHLDRGYDGYHEMSPWVWDGWMRLFSQNVIKLRELKYKRKDEPLWSYGKPFYRRDFKYSDDHIAWEVKEIIAEITRDSQSV